MIDILFGPAQIDALLTAAPLLLVGLFILGTPVGGRPWLAGGAAALSLLLIWTVPAGAPTTVIADLGRLFATIFAFFALTAGIYAGNRAKRIEMGAGMVSGGSAVAIALAPDFVLLFVFWEVLAVASAILIAASDTPKARGASFRYLALHLLGGTVMLAGIAGHVAQAGTTEIMALSVDTLATQLILLGVLVNAAAMPLHAWLPDAYPEASPFGTVFLSAFTTKAAVFVLLAVFPGTTILIGIGLVMIFWGIIYALLENDVRRILSYSIMNQVGFMVTAAGIGTPLAINGGAAHAFCHIIYKGLLMMSAGAVTHQTGLRKCTDLGGLIKSMPQTAVLGIIGALAISAVPLTSGFAAKSLTTSAATSEHMITVYLLLQAAAAGVFLHAGIKFPWFVFFNRDSGLRPPEPPKSMLAAMYILAVLSIALGCFPQWLYAMLPYSVDYTPYTGGHVVMQMQLLLFSALAFFLLLPLMRRTETISLDVDWVYRRLVPDGAGRIEQRIQELRLAAWTKSLAITHRIAGLRTIYQRNGAPLPATTVQFLAVSLLLALFLLVPAF